MGLFVQPRAESACRVFPAVGHLHREGVARLEASLNPCVDVIGVVNFLSNTFQQKKQPKICHGGSSFPERNGRVVKPEHNVPMRIPTAAAWLSGFTCMEYIEQKSDVHKNRLKIYVYIHVYLSIESKGTSTMRFPSCSSPNPVSSSWNTFRGLLFGTQWG